MKSICIAEEEVLKLVASAVRHHITDRQVLLAVWGLLYHHLHEISFGSIGVRTPQRWWVGGGDLKWYPAAHVHEILESFCSLGPLGNLALACALEICGLGDVHFFRFGRWKKKRNLKLCYLAQSGAICFGWASKRRWRIFLRRRTTKELAQTKLPRGHFDGNLWIRTVFLTRQIN